MLYTDEADFRRDLIHYFRANHVLARPIETGMTTVAFPDVYAVLNGCPSLIELKRIRCPGPTDTRIIPFRPGQHSFLSRNKKEGGNSFVGIAYNNAVFFQAIDDITDDDYIRLDRPNFTGDTINHCLEWLFCRVGQKRA